MSETNGRIEVGQCRCPGAVHGEDWVELYPELTLDGGLLVAATVGPNSGLAQTEVGPAALVGLFTTEIREWSFLSPEGEPVPITKATVRQMLPFAQGGAVIANRLVPRLEEATSTDPFKVRTTRRSSASGRTRGRKPTTGPDSTSAT